MSSGATPSNPRGHRRPDLRQSQPRCVWFHPRHDYRRPQGLDDILDTNVRPALEAIFDPGNPANVNQIANVTSRPAHDDIDNPDPADRDFRVNRRSAYTRSASPERPPPAYGSEGSDHRPQRDPADPARHFRPRGSCSDRAAGQPAGAGPELPSHQLPDVPQCHPCTRCTSAQ